MALLRLCLLATATLVHGYGAPALLGARSTAVVGNQMPPLACQRTLKPAMQAAAAPAEELTPPKTNAVSRFVTGVACAISSGKSTSLDPSIRCLCFFHIGTRSEFAADATVIAAFAGSPFSVSAVRGNGFVYVVESST